MYTHPERPEYKRPVHSSYGAPLALNGCQMLYCGRDSTMDLGPVPRVRVSTFAV